MRKSNELIRNLAATADVMNLLSGGLSEPEIKIVPLANAHQLEIRLPGVDARTLSVEINNGTLNVYHLLEMVAGDQMVRVPRKIFGKPIPHFINVSGIEASVGSGNKLLIQLPFNERANGYRREVRIKEP
ncbi:MAG TPA: Hsp20/alpha crystallin family protein [Cyclobacteriaceae bacterium]|nr:Hsp20/alpha crystallin family protein [Cyclobacteriaceae bacterium]